MKIGIVTVHDSSNYGSFLQAFALNNVLKRMGHEVYFIRTRDKNYIRRRFFYNIKPQFPHVVRMYEKFKEDMVKYNAFKNEWKLLKTIEKADDIKLDRIILGSDEIWNVTTNVFKKPIFYGVGLDNVKTYGISISRATKEDFEQYPEIENAIQRINPVLVRDDNTKKVIDEITGRDNPMVADPTFLCDVSEFEKEVTDYKKIDKKYILVYSYLFNDEIKQNIIRFAREHDLLIVSACIRHSFTDDYVNGSPLTFCRLLKDAEYVVTTTFHGTVFSVLNHKKFIAEPFTPKVVDVLNKVGLSDALIEVGADYETFSHKLTQNLNYEEADKNILEWRERSLKLLQEQLK